MILRAFLNTGNPGGNKKSGNLSVYFLRDESFKPFLFEDTDAGAKGNLKDYLI